MAAVMAPMMLMTLPTASVTVERADAQAGRK